jgi:hypothetical protein
MIKAIFKDYLEDDYLVPWRAFIRIIKQSNPVKIAWDSCCMDRYKKTIVLQKDCLTRWSSTISMLEKCVSVKDAVLKMISEAPQSHKDQVPMWKKIDWELLTKVNELLRPVALIIKKLEGTAYPTQSLILTLLVCLEKHIEKCKKLLMKNLLLEY